ncbi:MAG TPA: O-antigen ligase family protein [Acidiferrobacter sp.]|nr:O-antigen ligase family protein [Acidiferrobacter sp.]
MNKPTEKPFSLLGWRGINNLALLGSLDSILFLLSALLPAAYLTIREPDLLGLLAILLLLISSIVLWREDFLGAKISKIDRLPLVLLSMTLPTAAVLIAASLRFDFHFRDIDGPSRMLLCLPMFFAFYIRKIDFSRSISVALPLALAMTFVYALTHNGGFGDRLTVLHMNPILWGDSSMVLGFMCLYSIQSTDSVIKKAYLLAGLATGIAMSILSQSRGGWVAGIALLLFWGWLHRKSIHPWHLVIGGVACVAVAIGLYLFSGIIHQRVDEAFDGVYGYVTGRDVQSSTGYRLAMWKIGLYLFAKHPLLGYGDRGVIPYLNNPYIHTLGDAVAINGIRCCGPHNEIIAQLLRSGVFGFLSLAGTYVIPMYVFWKSYVSGRANMASSQAMSLIIGFFVSALTIEMLTLKVAWTFYALFMAGLMATVAWRQDVAQQ